MQREHGLENRRVGWVALNIEAGDQLLEGYVLVHKSIEGELAHPAAQFIEGRCPVRVPEPDVQRQGIGEKADRFFEFFEPAAGDGNAHHHGFLAGIPSEQGRPGGQQHHKKGGAAFGGKGVQRGRLRRTQAEGEPGATEGLEGRPREIRRQGQKGGGLGQVVAVIQKLAFEPFAAQVFVLPDGQIGKLSRRPGQTAGRRIQGLELLEQQRDRPAVGGDVVHGQQQHVQLVIHPQDFGPQQQILGKVERLAGESSGARLSLGLGADGRDWQHEGPRRVDDLPGLLIDLHEAGAQRRVPLYHFAECLLEAFHIERTMDGESAGQHVGAAAGLEFFDEIKPLLREGERQRHGQVGSAQRRRGHRVFFLAGAEVTGQGAEGCVVEKLTQRHEHAEAGADPGEQAGGQQGVAAQREEVVFEADVLSAEHLRPQSRQLLVERAARRRTAGRVARGELGRRQRAAIHLAGLGERQRGELLENRRHHVVRQICQQVTAQLVFKAGLVFACRHQVGDQRLFARGATR